MLTSCEQPVDFRFPNIIELTNVNQLCSLHPTPKVLSGSLASLNRNLLIFKSFRLEKQIHPMKLINCQYTKTPNIQIQTCLRLTAALARRALRRSILLVEVFLFDTYILFESGVCLLLLAPSGALVVIMG